MSSKLYQAIIRKADPLVPTNLRPLWEHPAGPKTIFFWAPLFKWGLVIAGLSDLQRPAEKLSVYQSSSLFLSACVWSRYSLVVIPKNYSLFAVNVFVATSQFIQLVRAYNYQLSLKKDQ